jgi:hypothetical protein
MKTFFLFALVVCIGRNYAFSQHSNKPFNQFGLRAGAGISNQHWEYKQEAVSYLSGWKENKTGWALNVFTVRKLNAFLSIRPEIGYLQKGFKDDIVFTTAGGEVINTDNNTVRLHNLSFNLPVMYRPFKIPVNPYLFAGLRTDCLLGYQDYEIEVQGKKFGLYGELLDDYRTFVLSGLLGMGIAFKDIFTLDFEYYPALTKNLDQPGISIKDRYFGFMAGVNLQRITKAFL